MEPFIIPAIDLLDNRCVRLRGGDYSQATFYPLTPLEQALKFQELGYSRLHLVDLEGSRQGKPFHLETLEKIISKTDLIVDFSGGLRTLDDIDQVLAIGAHRICLGTIAAREPTKMRQWIERNGSSRCIVAVDVRGDTVAVAGWLDNTQIHWKELIPHYLDVEILCTSIERDGKKSGPNTELYQRLIQTFPEIQLIASGGVTRKSDVEELQAIGVKHAVVGKALLDGELDISCGI